MKNNLNQQRPECRGWDIFGTENLQNIFGLAEIFARRTAGEIIFEEQI